MIEDKIIFQKKMRKLIRQKCRIKYNELHLKKKFECLHFLLLITSKI